METMLRHWTLLRTVPRAPRKLDARTLTDRLREEGFDVSKRTVERDLRKLSAAFPLTNDEAPVSCGWFWPRESELFDIPGMDPESALTLRILERFAAPLLPGSVLRRLEPQLHRAASVLEQLPEQAGPRIWPDRVRVLPRTMNLQPPDISPAIAETVYRGLLEGRRIEADYRPRVEGGAKTKTYEINPLGLVFRDQVVYLVATLWEYSDIRQLALHRFQRAELLDTERTEPEGFDLDEYIQTGHFDIRESGAPIELVARFHPDAAYHLAETPLTADQTRRETGDGRIEIKATVEDTQQLRWWLLGFGAGVEVIEPQSLRQELADEVRRMALRYVLDSAETADR